MGLWDGIGDFLREVTLPDEVARGIREGDAALRRKKFRTALEAYDRGLAEASDYAPLHVKRGMALHFLDDHLGALAAFDRALRLGRSERDAVFWRGKALAALDRPDEAAEAFRRCRALGFEHAHLDEALGLALLAAGKADRARVELERALRRRGFDEELLSALVRAMEVLDRPDRVVSLLERHGRGRTLPRALVLASARALRALGRPAEAMAGLQRLVSSDGADVEAFALLGACHMDLGEDAMAEGCLSRASRLDGAGAEVFAGLGRVLLATGRRTEAAAAFRAGTQRDEQDAPCALGLAWTELLDGRWDAVLDRAGLVAVRLETGALAAAAQALRAWAALRRGDAVEAESFLKKGRRAAGEGSEGDPPILAGARAAWAMRRGDFPEALALLRDALVGLDETPAVGPIPREALRVEIERLLDEAYEATRSQAMAKDERLVVPREKLEGPFATVSHGFMSSLNRLEVMVAGRHGLDEIHRELERIRADYDRPLLVVIMGEFNTGKSTFINALVGERVAPVGVVPTTATINVLKWGPEKKIRIRFDDGTVEEAPIDRLAAYVDERKGREEVLRAISTVEILYPLEVLQRVNVVDTPGLNAPIPEHERITRDYVASADAVLWLFNAGQAGKATEREALDFVRSHSKKVIACVNKIDRIEAEEVDTVVADLEKDFEGVFQFVGAVSAKQALEAILKDDGEGLGRSCFSAFLDRLSAEVFDRVRQIKDENGEGRLLELLARLDEARRRETARRGRWLEEGREIASRLDALGQRFEDEILPAVSARLRRALELGVKAVAREGAEATRRVRGLLGEGFRFEKDDRRWLEESFLAGYRSRVEEGLVDELRGGMAEELDGVARQGRDWLAARDVSSGAGDDGITRAFGLLEDFVVEEHLAYYRGLVAGGAMARVFDGEESRGNRPEAGRLAGNLLRALRLDGEGLEASLRRWYEGCTEAVLEGLERGRQEESRRWIEAERNLHAPAERLAEEIRRRGRED